MLAAIFASLAIACAGERTAVPSGQVESSPSRAWSFSALADLRSAAEAAPLHGLPAQTRASDELARLETRAAIDGEAARALDSAADALFERLALAHAMGHVSPEVADPDWAIQPPPPPDLVALRQAVAAGASPLTVLSELAPNAPEYAALMAELARVDAEPVGATDAAGLSREERIERLRANLERWRWLPRALPQRRVEALVPFFELRTRGMAASSAHRIIVGARRTQTPSFAAAIESITLNPTWTPPASIANGELLPRFRRDPAAAAREGFDVVDRAGAVVAPGDVNWSARPFPFTLRQRPGPSNALGRLRFDLPNPYAVHLHDTPSRGLFERDERALSHGCIRVAEPVQLAARVLSDPAWDEAALNAAIEEGATTTIRLSEPVAVYVLYLTAAPDENGAVRYADDIYGRDTRLLRALEARPQRVQAARPTATECATPT